jgi:hypothetical protein
MTAATTSATKKRTTSASATETNVTSAVGSTP